MCAHYTCNRKEYELTVLVLQSRHYKLLAIREKFTNENCASLGPIGSQFNELAIVVTQFPFNNLSLNLASSP